MNRILVPGKINPRWYGNPVSDHISNLSNNSQRQQWLKNSNDLVINGDNKFSEIPAFKGY